MDHITPGRYYAHNVMYAQRYVVNVSIAFNLWIHILVLIYFEYTEPIWHTYRALGLAGLSPHTCMAEWLIISTAAIVATDFTHEDKGWLSTRC